jgi:hypothetical protein
VATRDVIVIEDDGVITVPADGDRLAGQPQLVLLSARRADLQDAPRFYLPTLLPSKLPSTVAGRPADVKRACGR